METQQSISEWAVKTFGSTRDLVRAAIRANEEMAELLHKLAVDDYEGAMDELADVHIVLARVGTLLGCSIQKEVDIKMAKNRARNWKSDGSGHGYHVEEKDATTNSTP